MIVGIPKEIKPEEYRVAMTPAGVKALKAGGHDVLVEREAGLGSGFQDEEYVQAGAEMIETAGEVFERAGMIVKVKEPLPPEIPQIRDGQILFTYLHLAADRALTEGLLEARCIGLAYETVETADGGLPLLTPMSQIAGRLAVQMGARFLERPQGGRGVLLGGVPGVRPASVLILGAGIVGMNAARMAMGLGAEVIVSTRNAARLRRIDEVYFGRIRTLKMTRENIEEAVREADLVVGAVLVTGDKAPRLITREMLKTMKKGAVIVDVSIDQGGIAETSRPTYHNDPVYEVDGVIHYCVANMPGCVPRTATLALTNETLPYAVEIADKGWQQATRDDPALARGLNVCLGKLTCKPVADLFALPYTPPEEATG